MGNLVCVYVCRYLYLPGRYVCIGYGGMDGAQWTNKCFQLQMQMQQQRAASCEQQQQQYARTMYSSVTFIYKSNDKPTKSQLKF